MVKKLRDIKKSFARFSPARKQARKEGTDAKVSNKFTKVKASVRAAGTREDGSPGARAIGHAIWSKVTNRSANTDKAMTLQQRAQNLVKKHGSQRAAAKAAGINARSFDRAFHGKNLSKKNVRKIEEQERRESIRKTNARKLKNAMTGEPTNSDSTSPGNTFAVYVTIEISDGKPEDRWIYPGRIEANGGIMDDIDDLVAAGPEAMHDRVQEMMDNYVAGNVTEVHHFNW